MRNNFKTLICFLLAFLVSHSLIAKEKKAQTLLIISDSKVNFYSSSQKSFLDNFKGEVVTMDLSAKKWKSLSKIKSKLYDIYPDVVYCIGTRAYLVAEKFIPEKNLVYSSTVNVDELPKNENAYGISSRLYPGMELMNIRHLMPKVKKLGVVYTDKYHRGWIKSTEQEAQKMGVAFTKVECDSVRGATVADLKKLKGVSALWLTPDPGAFPDYKTLKMVLDYCYMNKIPVVSYTDKFLAHKAVVMSVSVDTTTIGRQAAILVQDLLEKSEGVANVTYPAGTVIKMSLKRAKYFGVEVNDSALESVNEIID